jgi:UDP-N-acetylglucosamine transferase subunit ALG13
MILVTVGTNEQPFDRLVRAVGPLELDEPLVVQHGSCVTPGGRGRWVDFVSFEELEALMRQARLVVAHAGVGSIMVARRCGQRPIVVPRRLHLGEAVDDHQLPIARRLHARGLVELVEDVETLPDLLGAPERSAVPATRDGELPDALALADDVREYLEGTLNLVPSHPVTDLMASRR